MKRRLMCAILIRGAIKGQLYLFDFGRWSPARAARRLHAQRALKRKAILLKEVSRSKLAGASESIKARMH